MKREEFLNATLVLVKEALERRQAKHDAAMTELLAQIKAIPAGEKGADGKDGLDGRDGKDAEFDKDALVREVVSLIPTPKDGKDGKRGEKGADGRDGRDGKDGIASLDDLRSEVAKAVDASVGPLVQKQVAETVAALPTLQYQGVFREGTTYKAGHCVTWAGAMWHANAETKEKPGEGQTAWTLMVKKGDKGKDAR